MSKETPVPVNPLEQALATILQKTVNAVEAGVNFLSGQLPDVIQQLLMWHAVKSGIFFTILLIISLAFAYITRKLLVKDDWDDYFLIQLVTGVLGAVFFFFAMHHLEWLQILVAPKLYLIEYAAELYKGAK